MIWIRETMKTYIRFISLLALPLMALFINACQTTGEVLSSDTAVVEDSDTPTNASASNANTDPDHKTDDMVLKSIADEVMAAQKLLNEPDSPLSNRIIYFDWDSATIDDKSLILLEAHGSFIADNSRVSVRLEGHTDERGSREYNIALGDRRAQSVRRVLLFQGAVVDQIETISYGEEQPVLSGHNETAWGKNRRVELIYRIDES